MRPSWDRTCGPWPPIPAVRQDDGSVEKILFLAIDSTEQKKQSLDYEGQIDAIDRLNAKAIFSPDGRLQLSNQLFPSLSSIPIWSWNK